MFKELLNQPPLPPAPAALLPTTQAGYRPQSLGSGHIKYASSPLYTLTTAVGPKELPSPNTSHTLGAK